MATTGPVLEGRPTLGGVPDRAGGRHERGHVPLPRHHLHAPVQHQGAVAREGVGRRGCCRGTAHERERRNRPVFPLLKNYCDVQSDNFSSGCVGFLISVLSS